MLSTPLDAFIFMAIVSAMIFIAAVVAKSPILGSFSGLFFVLTGIYGMVNNLTPLTAPLSTGVSFLWLVNPETGLFIHLCYWSVPL